MSYMEIAERKADVHSGYGRSTARKVTEDYAQENVNKGMLELLKHTGRDKAIWIGRSPR